jgi:nucleoside-diphosphate-sugar epimerase
MGSAVLVTGATGFLGSHLALTWLEQFPDDTVACLARRDGAGTARERVLDSLRKAERDSASHDVVARNLERIVVVEDDLLSRAGESDPAVEELEALGIDSFWHSAASAKCVENDAHEVWNTNVGGVENALALAHRLHIPIFNQISTAYSCGTMSGRIFETIDRDPDDFNNIYEKSKHHGEQLVRRYCDAEGLAWRIIRPSIIIGHSQTFRTSSAAGFYYCLDALRLLHDRVATRERSYFDRHALRVGIDRNATLNLIPVDFVSSEMVDIHRRGSATLNQAFHVTSESPVSLCDWLKKCGPMIGIQRIEFVDDESVMSALDRVFTRQVKAFLPCMKQRKVFDRSNAARHGIEGRQLDYLLDTERLASFAETYLESACGCPDAMAEHVA